MAYWINKRGGDVTTAKQQNTGGQKGAKEDKKNSQIKRIDNLRVNQKLRIRLRSVGVAQEHSFVTRDLSATGVFVMCTAIERYPFQPGSTLLEAFLDLKADGGVETITFLARIARIVNEPKNVDESGAVPNRGFGLRIVQISFEQRQILETFITLHGSVTDPLSVELGQAV